jgi:hypothetical protein
MYLKFLNLSIAPAVLLLSVDWQSGSQAETGSAALPRRLCGTGTQATVKAWTLAGIGGCVRGPSRGNDVRVRETGSVDARRLRRVRPRRQPSAGGRRRVRDSRLIAS